MCVCPRGRQVFRRRFVRGDYYTAEHGVWGGKAAERLGLRGEVTRDDFLALTSNKVPGTERTLTVRTKDNRTAGYDMCFSVPKSVSLYLAETDDPALERMIQEAFKETMADAENRMEARVRVGDQDDNRTVANMVYAAFVHRETRPIGGYQIRIIISTLSR